MKVGFSSRRSGFTFIELLIVVTILGLLAAIGIPNYVHAQGNTRLSSIYNNLRQIENAKTVWALENRKTTGDTVGDLAALSSYFRNGTIQEVIRETYIPNPVGTPAAANLPSGVGLGPYGAGAAIPAP